MNQLPLLVGLATAGASLAGCTVIWAKWIQQQQQQLMQSSQNQPRPENDSTQEEEKRESTLHSHQSQTTTCTMRQSFPSNTGCDHDRWSSSSTTPASSHHANSGPATYATAFTHSNSSFPTDFPSSTNQDQLWSHPSLAPLLDFFERHPEIRRPQITFLAPAAVPEPAQTLIVHHTNTTPTLSTFWNGQKVGLNVIEREMNKAEGVLRRWITLEVEKNEHQPIRPSRLMNGHQRPMNGNAPSSSLTTATYDSFSANQTRRPSSFLSAARLGVVNSSTKKHPPTSSTPVKPPALNSPKPGRLRFQESIQKAAAATTTNSSSHQLSNGSSSLVATTAHNRIPVEFSSIRIYVDRLPSDLHDDIWMGTKPFHTLLAQRQPPIDHTCHPEYFFRMSWNDDLRQLLNLSPVHDLTTGQIQSVVYGRTNALRDSHNSVICDVVEIIPPMA